MQPNANFLGFEYPANGWQPVHVGRLCHIWSVLEWTYFLCSEICSKEMWLLIQVRFFTPLHLLTLYKAQIRPCLEYGSHLWRRASEYSLATLDTIQKRAIRLIDDSALTDSLDSLAHRRNVSAFSLYYRYNQGGCSDESKSIIPPQSVLCV